MIFNSMNYIIFFIITVIVYYLTKTKYRYIIILIANIVFYAFTGITNLVLLLFITLISYFSGYLISKESKINKKKIILIFSIILNVLILLIFKYYNFIVQSFNIKSIENFIIPLGISFYVLQAMTYPIDIYRRDIKLEKSILVFATFISFFPSILSGPIGKSKDMLPQFRNEHKFNYKKMKEGFIFILYGFFQKIVIADCLSIGVNNVYANLFDFKGIPLLITVVMYSFQIYFDFASYSNIAYGCAKMLDYDVIKNFNSPYLANSIKNFWSRWHISLSTWFKDYLYIPLGGNRKGKIGAYINILIVFIVSGFWHGTAWTYIVWGLLHGLYQVFERINKFKIKNNILNIIATFILVTIAWIFFRSNSVSDAIYVIVNMFKINLMDVKSQIYSIGLDKYDILVATISVTIIYIIEIINEKKNILTYIKDIPDLLRWIIYILILFIILVFGYYGPGFSNAQFIYLGY